MKTNLFLRSSSKQIKFFLCIIIVLALAFSSLTCIASANDIAAPTFSEVTIEQSASPRSVGAVVVLLAGVIIGYVIDGVIVYATGHSAAELTAQWIRGILAAVKNNPKATSVHVSSSGAIHTGASGKF